MSQSKHAHTSPVVRQEFLPVFDEISLCFRSDLEHSFRLSDRLISLLFELDRIGYGSLGVFQTLRSPEGRHAFYMKIQRETLGCARMLGWDAPDEAVFSQMIVGLRQPLNARELLLRRFAGQLPKAPGAPVSVGLIEQLYADMLQGIDVAPSDNDVTDTQAVVRRRAILDGVTAIINQQYGEYIHPCIRALAVYVLLTTLRPFPAANLIIARLVYGWVLFSTGLGFINAAPILEFLESWQRDTPLGPNRYQPKLDYQGIMMTADDRLDWSSHLEELFGFMGFELGRFSNKLHGLHARRGRLTRIFEAVKPFNHRQKELLIEALVHEDAEFTFAQVVNAYQVGYATAHADLNQLAERDFLIMRKSGKQVYFVAQTELRERLHKFLQSEAPERYREFYDDQGRLITFGDKRGCGQMACGWPVDEDLLTLNFPVFEVSSRMKLLDDFEM